MVDFCVRGVEMPPQHWIRAAPCCYCSQLGLCLVSLTLSFLCVWYGGGGGPSMSHPSLYDRIEDHLQHIQVSHLGVCSIFLI